MLSVNCLYKTLKLGDISVGQEKVFENAQEIEEKDIIIQRTRHLSEKNIIFAV